MLFAWFFFVFPAGTKFFLWLNDGVIKLMNASTAGSKFLFGPLAASPGEDGSLGFILAFQALPTIIFFSALVSILYYFRIIPRVVEWFAHVFTKLMGISGAESLCAASNIFVGVESLLTVKPFLKRMTSSELCTVLTAGMATVSSNVLILYVMSLQNSFPNIAGHLISASLLSAPAALALSKLLLPESEKPETLGENIKLTIEQEPNVISAIINGANNGVRLIVGIAALLVAVLGLVHLLDQIIGWVGHGMNGLFTWDLNWSLKSILSVIFYPLTYLLGIPAVDVRLIAPIIAERLIVTEVVSYQNLALLIEKGLLSSTRSMVITTYALCGFAHFASLSIFVGGVAALAPEKTQELSKVGLRALGAATLACLMTAAVAGIFITDQTMLLR